MEEKVVDKLNVKKSKNLILGVTIIILCIITIAMFLQIVRSANNITEEYVTMDPEEYFNWDGHISMEQQELKSGLYLFPEQELEKEDMRYFYYCCTRNIAANEYLICAEVTYSTEEFQNEVQRILEVECEIPMGAKEKSIVNKVEYTKKDFAYPAYVAVYNANLSYEYALLKEAECKIIYVYMQGKDGNKVLPTEYLPVKYQGKDIYKDNSWNNINIYFGQDKSGDYTFYRQ